MPIITVLLQLMNRFMCNGLSGTPDGICLRASPSGANHPWTKAMRWMAKCCIVQATCVGFWPELFSVKSDSLVPEVSKQIFSETVINTSGTHRLLRTIPCHDSLRIHGVTTRLRVIRLRSWQDTWAKNQKLGHNKVSYHLQDKKQSQHHP